MACDAGAVETIEILMKRDDLTDVCIFIFLFV